MFVANLENILLYRLRVKSGTSPPRQFVFLSGVCIFSPLRVHFTFEGVPMHRIILPAVFLALLVSAAPGQTDSSKGLKVGDPAPDFSLPYATRDSVAEEPLKLSSLYGKGPIV